MKKKNIENVTDEILTENIVIPEGLSPSYEVRSCADLFRMYKNNQLEIQPEFQRNFVWTPIVQTRFIDSLIKKLPIPNLFIGMDIKDEKYIIIDGMQRISTIIKFFENEKWRLTRLPDIDTKISGKKVSDIKNKSNELYSRIENLPIPITIIKYDFSKPSSQDYLFTIFHRLNTGVQKLNNQEIRNCVYSGKFNNLLKEIANSEQWMKTIGVSSKVNRLENEELLLRVFALTDKLDEYTGNLAKFLNYYMAEKKDISNEEIEEKKNTLNSVLSIINKKIDFSELINTLNRTVKEALLVGIYNNISTLEDHDDIQYMFEELINDDEFSEANLSFGLSKKEKVQSRLRRSIEIFSQ